MDIYPPAVQRSAMLAFAAAVMSSEKALRRDECGDWRIKGRFGAVYAVPEGYQLHVLAGSLRRWKAVKAVFSFAELACDGDDEGLFVLDRLPNAEEAAWIRARLGIRKRRELDEVTIEKLRERLKSGLLAA